MTRTMGAAQVAVAVAAGLTATVPVAAETVKPLMAQDLAGLAGKEGVTFAFGRAQGLLAVACGLQSSDAC